MEPRPRNLATGAELLHAWADARGVQYNEAGKSFEEIAQDYFETSDAYREVLVPKPIGPTSASQQAAVGTAHARALLIEAAIGSRGGDHDLYVDPVQVFDPEGRIVPRTSTPEPCGQGEFIEPTSVAEPDERPQPHDFLTATTGFRP